MAGRGMLKTSNGARKALISEPDGEGRQTSKPTNEALKTLILDPAGEDPSMLICKAKPSYLAQPQ